ncbi:MAG: IS5 family transposase [Gammaproteobacteria bacterium]|nr:IS5 family transposase [Gammaproteobacteria bacterium]
MGSSRGGRTTKIHLVANSKKKPIRVLITPGNDHDVTMFNALVDGLEAKACLADKAYDAKRVIESLNEKGIEAVIPHRTCSEPRELNTKLYRIRYLIECCFHDLKRFRRIATRYEKTARNYAAFLSLACSTLWLN